MRDMRFPLKGWRAVLRALVLGATAVAKPAPKRAWLIVSKTSRARE